MTQVARFDAKLSGIFKGLGKVKAAQDANYILPGNYIVRLDRFKADQARKGPMVAIEMTVLAVLGSSQPQVDEKPNQPMESVTHLIPNFGNGKDMFGPNVKAFVENVVGLPPEEANDDDKLEGYLLDLCADAQPMRGTVIHVEARQITTRSNTPFTKVSYQREVPAEEALKIIDPKVAEWAYPNNGLQRRVIFETAIAQGKTPAEAQAAVAAAFPVGQPAAPAA